MLIYRPSLLFTVLLPLLLSAPSVTLAGKSMDVCRDANGRAYFSDRGCPEDTIQQGRDYIPSAQSSRGTPSPDNRIFTDRDRTDQGSDLQWRREPELER
jgi:hypothetical protein